MNDITLPVEMAHCFRTLREFKEFNGIVGWELAGHASDNLVLEDIEVFHGTQVRAVVYAKSLVLYRHRYKGFPLREYNYFPFIGVILPYMDKTILLYPRPILHLTK